MEPVPFKPLQFHHLYWGIIIATIGAYKLFESSNNWWWLLLGLGIFTILDDVNQHFGNGYSVLNKLFHWLWPRIFGGWWPFGTL